MKNTAALLTLLGMLILAACGGSEAPAETTGQTTPDASAKDAAPGETETVILDVQGMT